VITFPSNALKIFSTSLKCVSTSGDQIIMSSTKLKQHFHINLDRVDCIALENAPGAPVNPKGRILNCGSCQYPDARSNVVKILAFLFPNASIVSSHLGTAQHRILVFHLSS